MISKELELAYLELEIDERNLDVYQANADRMGSQASIEQERVRVTRANNAEKRAKLDLRRLQEEIEALKKGPRAAEPIADALPVSSVGAHLSVQACEDLRLIRSSIGTRLLTTLPSDLAKLYKAWFEVLESVFGEGDASSDELCAARNTLTQEITKNTTRDLIGKMTR